MQDDRQPVNFWLDDELRFFHAVVNFGDALQPGARVFCAKRVRETQNRRGVANLVETVSRFGSRALRGRVGSHPVGMRGFDPLEFVVEFVVLRVADDGRILHMIKVEVKI